MRKKVTAFDYINVLLMFIVGFVTVYPLLYVVSVSFSETIYILQNKVALFPKGFNVDAYAMILQDKRIPRAYLNSVIYAGVGTFINIIITAITAYPLSRKSLFGRNIIMKLIVFTMLFTGGIIPNYVMVQKLGMIDSIWAIVIPSAIGTFELLILKTFFEGFEESIRESAIIDGASEYRIFAQLILPLSKAGLASIGMFYFVYHWNNFFQSMIYLNDMKKHPLQVVLRDMLMDNNSIQNPNNSANLEMVRLTPVALRNATIFITMIPIFLVYPYAQRHFVKGAMLGSIKG